MGSYETSTAGDQNPLAFRRREEFDRGKTRQSGIRDRFYIWMVNRLGLVRSMALREFGVLSVEFFVVEIDSLAIGQSCIMRTEIQRSEDIKGNLAIETEAIETNGGDLDTVFIKSANLRRWLVRNFSCV